MSSEACRTQDSDDALVNAVCLQFESGDVQYPVTEMRGHLSANAAHVADYSDHDWTQSDPSLCRSLQDVAARLKEQHGIKVTLLNGVCTISNA